LGDLHCRRDAGMRLLSCPYLHVLIPIKSLVLGRPQGISLAFVDCEFPEDDVPALDEDGQPKTDCELVQMNSIAFTHLRRSLYLKILFREGHVH
jgi:hypothetical protein